MKLPRPENYPLGEMRTRMTTKKEQLLEFIGFATKEIQRQVNKLNEIRELLKASEDSSEESFITFLLHMLEKEPDAGVSNPLYTLLDVYDKEENPKLKAAILVALKYMTQFHYWDKDSYDEDWRP